MKERERELEQKNHIINMLRTDRDQARATLEQHGLQVNKDIQVWQWAKAAISRLTWETFLGCSDVI